VLANDRQQTSTLRDHAVEGEGGGRFAELARREGAARPAVVGATPAVQYPAGPAWVSDGAGVGIEPPLGICVNDLEPTGEPFEVERSLANLAEAAAPTSAAASPVVVVETASAVLKKRRKL
jgi:hypothetical protein